MKSMRSAHQHGVSLVEALVAMAVMAIGMLGLVGMQTTLRTNSDVSKQRSEAVRIAHEVIENARSFATLSGDPGSYAARLPDGTVSLTTVTPEGSSTAYTPIRTVATLDAPRQGKSVKVVVEWKDRTAGDADAPQSITLATLIAGIGPELAATLAIPGEGDVLRRPQGRHRGIPVTARVLPSDPRYSGMIPPGTSGVAWRFDNVSGIITLCSTSATTTNSLDTGNITCTDNLALLLSGYMRYSYGPTPPPVPTQPTPFDAANPASPPDPLPPIPTVTYRNDANINTDLTMTCSFQNSVGYTAYYCAVPVVVVVPGVPPKWWGSLHFTSSLGATMALAVADVETTKRRACRYAPAPATYSNVLTSIANQNYLFIRAGDGTNPFTCPAGTATHQPTS